MMNIDEWPEYARIAWFTSFVNSVMLSLNASGTLRLREAEVSSVADYLTHRVPSGIDWPMVQASDDQICRLRFIGGFTNDALFEQVRAEGIMTAHKRVPDMERAWGACFQTILHATRRDQNHPLRTPLWNGMRHARPEFVTKLLELRKS